MTLRAWLDGMTRIYVAERLRENRGHAGKTAVELDISRERLGAIMRELGILKPFPKSRVLEMAELWNRGWSAKAIQTETGARSRQNVNWALLRMREQGKYIRTPQELGSWPIVRPSRFRWDLPYCYSRLSLEEVMGKLAKMLHAYAGGWRRASQVTGRDLKVASAQLLVAQNIDDAAALLEHRAFRDFGKKKR
jgi:hypothetical protein